MLRNVLLTILLVITVCASAFAFDWFRKKTPSDAADLKGIQAALANFAPTEAEAKAIADLRKKTLAQTGGLTPPRSGASDGELPAEAAPADVDNFDVQIAVECRPLVGKESVIRQITAIPALTWTGVSGNSKRLSSTGLMPGTVSSSVGTQMPIFVRFLEQTNAQKLFEQMTLYRAMTCCEAPKVMLPSGHSASINNDTTEIPFVTSVQAVEHEDGTCYQPVVQIVELGQKLLIQTTLLQDDSIRLDKCRLDVTSLAKVDTFKLVDDSGNVQFAKTKENSGLTIQVPTLRSFRAEIPEIIIPQGMSLLVAFPGAEFPYEGSDESYGAFLLITPRVIHDEPMSDASTGYYTLASE